MDTNEILQRNHVRIIGEGSTPIVFAHGFGCDQQVWNQVIPAFVDDYQIILFDYVGSGKSDKSAYTKERYGDFNGYVQDVLEIVDAFRLKDIIFVGHSVSSMIGMLASIKRPDLFKKLFMIGPSPRYINEPGYEGGFDKEDIDELLFLMEKNYKEWAKYLAPVVMKNEDRPQLAEEFTVQLCSNDPIIAKQFAEVTFLSDVRNELENVTVPTVILQPSEDAISPPEVGAYVHEHIQGSKLVMMKAAGHNPHMSDPEETVVCIKDNI